MADPVTDPDATAESDSGTRAEQSVQAFRDALEKSVTISRDRLQEVVDDAVKRGRMTRGDAEDLVGRLVSRGREQAEDIAAQVEGLLEQAKGAGAAVTEPKRTASRAADRAKRGIEDAADRARTEVGTRAESARKRAVDAVDQPLAGADRARRRAGLPGFPITAYDQLNVRQIDKRLHELTIEQLRRVRSYEQDNKARKGVLRVIDRKIDNAG
jgi:polyhydroxyalkanoate synthesis regulator phasin